MPYTINMNHEDYWIERAIDRDRAARKSEDKIIKELNKYTKEAFYEIRKELNDFYSKYATDNSITLQEAQMRLTPIEISEYREMLTQLEQLFEETNSVHVMLEINELTARAEITRMQSLLDSINVSLIKYSHNVQITMEDYLAGIYEREYRSTVTDAGASYIPPVHNVRAVMEIINYPYAGAMFSDRVWRNKRQLLNWINDELTKHIIKGSSVQRMAKDLMDKANVLKYQAERLVRTETNFVMTQGHLNGYKDANIKQYKILAHIDGRTSEICRRKNGQIINISDSIVGTNCPPFHPNCRTTIIPVI